MYKHVQTKRKSLIREIPTLNKDQITITPIIHLEILSPNTSDICILCIINLQFVSPLNINSRYHLHNWVTPDLGGWYIKMQKKLETKY